MDENRLACPVCGQPLNKENKTLKCPKAHTFDLSAKGYVNLLMSQEKHSHDPGDNREMVLARRRFLEKGFYKPLAEGIAQTLLKSLVSDKPEQEVRRILDAGCGEGYYTGIIEKALSASKFSYSLMGMDISKEAIKAAASKYKQIPFVVASLFKLPFQDHSQNMIINCFAPSKDSEFSRVIEKTGRLIVVIPGRNHLYALKGILYETPTYNDEKEPDLPSFVLESSTRVQGSILLEDNGTIQDLLSMTPYYWRTPPQGIQKLKEINRLETEIDFIILTYCPK